MIIALLQYLFTAFLYFRKKVKVCTELKKKWFLSGLWSWSWKWVCTASKYVLEPDEIVSTLGDCAKGAKEISETCTKRLVKCHDAGRCYVSKAATAIKKCTGGMIVPSGDCLKRNGF